MLPHCDNHQLAEYLFVGCLLYVPSTCWCISWTDLLRQVYVLPHWDRSRRSTFLSHPVTVYWHQADQSQRWPCNTRRLAGQPLEYQLEVTGMTRHRKIPTAKVGFEPRSAPLEADVLTTRPTRRSSYQTQQSQCQKFTVHCPQKSLTSICHICHVLSAVVRCNPVDILSPGESYSDEQAVSLLSAVISTAVISVCVQFTQWCCCIITIFFVCVPQLSLWGSPFLGEIFTYVTVF